MTFLYRFVLLGLLTCLITACETLYIDQPMQPAPIPVNSEPQPQPVPAGTYPYPGQPQPVPSQAYPNQPQPAPVPQPVRSQPLPSKAAMPSPAQAIDNSEGHVIPVRAPGSISDLPDPS
jgi:hypothetical protein